MQPENTSTDNGASPVSDQPASLSPDEIQWLRRLSQENFYFFAKFVLEFPFDASWLQKHIHKPICDVLQDYEKQTRVTVVLPRSWLKSTVCSVYYPIWRAIRDPSIRILIVQNSAPNAEKKLAAIRGQFEGNTLLRLLFADVLPDASCTWTTRSACLKRKINHPESTFETAGTRTKVISRHYDVVIEDDTVSPDLDELQESNVVPTKDDIGQAIGFHQQVNGILVDYDHSQNIIVGTRWFEVDLISWNQLKEPYYTRIERAVRETNGVPDPKGEVTYPERFGAETLRKLEGSWGPYLFSCLYMNRPLRSADMVFKEEWFRTYSDAPRNLDTYTTVDPAGGSIGKSKKAKASSDLDFNVVMTVGKERRTGDIFILEYDRFKGSAGVLINTIFEHQKRWGSLTVGIEGQQFQNSLDYFVTEQMKIRGQFFHIEMLKSIKSKEVRIRALQPLFAAGVIAMRDHHVELRSELVAFPLGAHDDVADALSMILQLLELTQQPGVTEDLDGSDNPLSLDAVLLDFQKGTIKDSDLVSEMLFDENENQSSTFATRNPKRDIFSNIDEESWHTDLIV
jgi:predicted phage terminase large subunit-like protein